ncbi:Transcriptional regulator [Rhodovulum sp. P5]|nr:Transcriptional regulator [Rhodovulum sp. P5]
MDHRLKGPARRLFFYLLTRSGTRIRREIIAEAVWPDGAPSRSAFNTTLWRLKKCLTGLPGITMECGNDTLMLDVAAPARLDIRKVLDAQAALSSAPEDLTLTELETLRAAVELWRGDFADGLSSNWALVMRERLLNTYIQALIALMRHAGRERRFEEALECGQRVLAVDPFREGIHCEVMWLLVLTGRRATAITRHKEFCTLLQRELGIGPMSETAALFDYIRTGLERCPDAPPQAPSSELTARRYEGYLQTVERSRASIYAALQTMYTGD